LLSNAGGNAGANSGGVLEDTGGGGGTTGPSTTVSVTPVKSDSKASGTNGEFESHGFRSIFRVVSSR